MVVLRLRQRLVQEDAPLLDGQAEVLRVADDVGPAELPGLVGRAHRQQVVELGKRQEARAPRPPGEDLRVLGRDELARPRPQ